MAGLSQGERLSFRAFRAARPAGCEYGYGHGDGLSGLREREFPRLREGKRKQKKLSLLKKDDGRQFEMLEDNWEDVLNGWRTYRKKKL